MSIQVHEGSEYEPIAAGAYTATLNKVEGPLDGEHGRYYKFAFEGEGERVYLGFASVPSDKDGKEKRITTRHKLGRWLCGLAGKPPQEMSIEPSEYYGRRYMLVYASNSQGNVSLNTFSPSA